ncbi:hypothetical protein BH23GEM3_BH23GEM3_26180 [soil metagenome]
MKLPFAEQAIVPAGKITHYLLDIDHAEGGPKAAYFLGLGYTLDDPKQFQDDLLLLGRTSEMKELLTSFGPKYVGSGSVVALNRRVAEVTTVWILRDGSPPPRFVTAYPA